MTHMYVSLKILVVGLLGPVVKNLPFNAGDVGFIPGQRTKIPHVEGQLNPFATTTESSHSRAHAPQQERPAHHNKDSILPKKARERKKIVICARSHSWP